MIRDLVMTGVGIAAASLIVLAIAGWAAKHADL